MRKALFVIILLSMVFFAPLLAEDSTTTTVTVASVVEAPIKENPAIIISFITPEISTTVTTASATTGTEASSAVITGLNLTEEGSLTFSLMTSEEITVYTNSTKLNLSIEILADGFHLYDDSSVSEGSILDESKIKQRNAVPIVSTTPEISIPQFYGQNENVEVAHSSGTKNTIEVQFNKGVTKANLVLGAFNVEWEGKRPLDAGIYKAKVSVVYSTP